MTLRIHGPQRQGAVRKDYDSNMKTCTFKLDDELGTEMTLNAQVKLFQSAFDVSLDGKGKISKYILEYDDEGHLVKVEYAGFGNVRVPDGQGIFGRRYVLDDEGKEVQLSHGTYIRLMESKNREVRRGAYEALYATYEQFQHTYAKTLQTNVKVQNYRAKVRNYKSARHAALAANFVPESVYDNLVAAVRKHLPLLHRY